MSPETFGCMIALRAQKNGRSLLECASKSDRVKCARINNPRIVAQEPRAPGVLLSFVAS